MNQEQELWFILMFSPFIVWFWIEVAKSNGVTWSDIPYYALWFLFWPVLFPVLYVWAIITGPELPGLRPASSIPDNLCKCKCKK